MMTSYINRIVKYAACLCMLMIFAFGATAQEAGQAKAQPATSDAAIQQFASEFPDHPIAKQYLAAPEDQEAIDAIREFVAANAGRINARREGKMREKETTRRQGIMKEHEEAREKELIDQRQRQSEVGSASPYDAYVKKHKDSPLVKRHLADPNDMETTRAIRAAMMLEYPEQFGVAESDKQRLAEEVESASFRQMYIQKMLDQGASQERAEYEYDKLPDAEKQDLINKSLQQKGYKANQQRNTGQDSPALIAE